MRKNAAVQLPDTSAPTPAGPGRRVAAVLVNTVLLAAAVAFSVRSIADFTRERIPPSIDRASACEVLNREVTTTWCEVRGDLVVYSANSHPVARVVLPPLAMSFANSVVLASLAGGSAGQLLLGLRVRRRSTGGRAGLLTHLLRWPLWPAASFGAVVVHARRAPVPVPAPTVPEDHPTADLAPAATDEPTTDEPTTDEPTTDEPTTDEPTTDEPTTDEPTTGDADDRHPVATDEPEPASSPHEPASMQPVPDDDGTAGRSPSTEGS